MGPLLKSLLRRLTKLLIVCVGAYVLFLILFFAICRFTKRDVGAIPNDEDLNPNVVTVADIGKNRRPLEDTYFTYPEWFIVWSYEERATYLEKGQPPSEFPYFGSIYQYWRGYCFICGITHHRKQSNFGDNLMLVVIGSSFSLEYAIRGLYENTIGRLSESTSGRELVDEDEYAARVAREYANFVYVRPWYEFHFGHALWHLWRETSFWGRHPLRKWERKAILSADYGLESIYAGILQLASHLTYGVEPTETYAWIENASEPLLSKYPHMRIVKEIGRGSYIVSIPRYQEFTELAVKLTKENVRFVQIAGNSEIVLSTVAQNWQYDTPEERVLFSEKFLTRPYVNRVVLECRVRDIHLVLNDLASRGYVVEHIYDY
jgi:hypothetical protein